MPRRRSPIGQWLGFLPAAVALGAASLLPWRSRLAFGAWLGRGLVRLPRFRRRIEANLAHVMPNLDAPARAGVARQVGDTFGRSFLETFALARFRREGGWTPATGPGVAAFLEAAEARRGVLLVTGHIGQWEAGRAWMKSVGVDCAGLYRPLNNVRLNRIYERNLIEGGPMFPKNARGLRGLVAHVAKGGVAAILTDQYDRRGKPFDFVGRTAPTTTFAADLALRYRLTLIPSYGLRDRDGFHVAFVLEEPIPHTTPEAMTQAINDSLAAQVRANPGQYFWLHLRWDKNLPGLKGRR